MAREPSGTRDAGRSREDALTRTEQTIRRLKQEVSALVDTVGQSFDELRELARTNTGPPPIPMPEPTARPPEELEPAVAAIVRAELERVLPNLVREGVDKRFRALTEAIQARAQQSGGPMQKLRASSSRIHR